MLSSGLIGFRICCPGCRLLVTRTFRVAALSPTVPGLGCPEKKHPIYGSVSGQPMFTSLVLGLILRPK